MSWGYVMLVLSIVFNGLRYNLESTAMKAGHAGVAPLSVWGVLIVGSFAGGVGFLLAGWLWRTCGWTWGAIERVSFSSCVSAARAQGWLVVAAALASSCGGWCTTQSNKLYGPEFTAFLGNLIPVFMVLAGLLSGERLKRGEILAIIVTIAGAFIFSYQHGQVNWHGIGLMVVGSLVMTLKKTIMKHATGVGHLPSVMTLSLFLTAAWALGGALLSGQLHFGTASSIGLSIGGGIAGAMIGMSLLYAGLNVVGLSRGAPIDSLRPLAVLAIGMLAGTALPAQLQLIGGTMVLLGSAALARMGSGAKKPAKTAAAT